MGKPGDLVRHRRRNRRMAGQKIRGNITGKNIRLISLQRGTFFN
jgi:hypothetical protein